MATHGYCNVNVKFKEFILVACFLSILFEWNAIQLFLWPVEHSCARSPNLSSFSSLLTDARNDSINPDAVQRNLIDATPEDSFTLARATSMGIDYDDISRCFEYPVDYADNQTRNTIINMESLESCRYGMHFETNEPNLSIVEHFNLTCKRQWIKNLLQQAFALGLLVGCLACHFELERKQASGPRVLSRSSLVLGLVWLIVFVATKRLHDKQLKSQQMDTAHGNSDLAKLVLCILLRSIAVTLTLCRVLIFWTSITDRISDQMDRTFKGSHKYFKLFSLMLILTKMLFMPIAMRLMRNWSILNRFLTFNMTLVVSLSLLIELAHSPEQLVRLRIYLKGRRGNEKFKISSRWHPIEIGYNSDEEEADVEELDSSMSKTTCGPVESSSSMLGLRPDSSAREASSWRVCEFCSVNEQKIYSPNANLPSATGGSNFLTIETTMSTSSAELFDPLRQIRSTYEPTTVSLGVAAHEMTDSQNTRLARNSGIPLVRHAANSVSNGRVQHNASLLELELFRWPLTSKLVLLTFCLAFNYFLMQTIPNHKLLHSEPIASLAARKLDHVHGHLSASMDTSGLANDHAYKIPLIMFEGSLISSDLNQGVEAHSITLTSNTTPAYLVTGTDRHDESAKLLFNDKLLHNTTALSQSAIANNSSSTVSSQTGLTDESKHPSAFPAIVESAASRNVTHLPADSDKSMQPVKGSGSKELAASVANTTHATLQQAPSATANMNLQLTPLLRNNETSRPKQVESVHGLTQTSYDVTILHARNETSGKNTNNNNTMAENRSIKVRVPLASVPRDDDSSRLLSSEASSYRLLFDYKSRNYATKTLDMLRDSNNPLEILWSTMKLNGWPIELAVMVLYSPSLTNFQSNNFKLNRLFVLVKHGTMLLVAEWLLVALIRAKNHLIELEWLLLVILTLARFLTTLLLYGHLQMLFRLAHKLQSSELLKLQHALPAVLSALALALMAPIVERIDLIIIPVSILLSNLLARYLASKVDAQLRNLLCPMMFENDE